ncbi:hypothetical protein [Micromonospora wenchangensis]|nr:hypothetical protein [Micromonospora wenchangensis]
MALHDLLGLVVRGYVLYYATGGVCPRGLDDPRHYGTQFRGCLWVIDQ